MGRYVGGTVLKHYDDSIKNALDRKARNIEKAYQAGQLTVY